LTNGKDFTRQKLHRMIFRSLLLRI